MTTGGGITNACNLNIETFGTSSAAIRTDRGGGDVNVEKSEVVTNGLGSPAIYSTANISVLNSNLTSTMSEGAIIEGKNSIKLEKCNLVDTNNRLNGQSTTFKNIFMYQSMSGDAETGQSYFSAKDSNITTNKGDTLYVTNTDAVATFENCSIVNNDLDGSLIKLQADNWGNKGTNGGKLTINFNNQSSVGNIFVDEISSLVFNLTNDSNWEGLLNTDNKSQNIELKISANSKIKLTGDCYIKSLTDDDSTYSNIDFNGHKMYVDGKPLK